MTIKESTEDPKPTPGETKPLPSPAAKKEDTVPSGEDGADAEPPFPMQLLEELEEMVSRPKWVVPVQPDAQLQELMRAAIDLCKKGLDTKSSACQRFFRDGLTSSFNKILTDDALSGWKPEIQRYIFYNCKDLVELCAAKIKDNWILLLDLLAMAFNPTVKFHQHNYSKQSDTVPMDKPATVKVVYARPDPRAMRGYLIDCINHFGNLDGFRDLRDHLCQSGESVSVSTIASCIRPFGNCAEYLTEECVQEFLMPVVDHIVDYLDGLSDADLKKESKNEARTDTFSLIIRSCRNICLRCPAREGMPQRLEEVCLQLYLRLLQTSSFNGKMNAINEINKMINSMSGYRHVDYSEWLTASRLADWIQTKDVLSILLRDNLHQPQYVEKLERIVRYVIKEKMMSLKDLDSIWAAQAGKHEAIVKNVHDLLAHLAWDFSAEQLDHLFQCFQASWVSASKKGREKLLELIRRLAEDDKEGMMAGKVLKLLWNLAHDEDCPPEIMDQALSALVKILDYSCSQESEQLKMTWIMDCVEELRRNKWVLPALKLIKDISGVFPPTPAGMVQPRSVRHNVYRSEALAQVNTEADLLTLVCNNLCQYMESVRVLVGVEVDQLDPDVYSPDDRYTHTAQLQERLGFIRYVLRDGQLWLVGRQAQQIWKCLAESAVFPADRGICFRWFSKLLGDEPDLDPESTCSFMEENVLKLDPSVLTEPGLKCFERFFRVVNQNSRRMTTKRRRFITETMDLVGLDYLWQVILHGPDEVVHQAIHLLKESVTNLSPTLLQDMAAFQKPFLGKCVDTLKSSFEKLQSAKAGGKLPADVERVHVTHLVRCLTLLKEFIGECDNSHRHERTIPLHSRAVRGRQLTLVMRCPTAAHGQVIEDFEVATHANELIAVVRRKALGRLKDMSINYQVDLSAGADILTAADDKKLVYSLPLRDRSVLTIKPSQSSITTSTLASTTSTIPSSPDSSSEDSNGSGGVTSKGPNAQLEHQLPGVIISQDAVLCSFLISLAEFGIANNHPTLRESVRNLLKIMPSDVNRVKNIRLICNTNADGSMGGRDDGSYFSTHIFSNGPAKALYNLEITLSLLMPSYYSSEKELLEFQKHFIEGGGIACMLKMLNGQEKFLVDADPVTRRSSFQAILKICKLMLTVVGFARLGGAQVESVDAEGNVVAGAEQATAGPAVEASAENTGLRAALEVTPNPASENWMRAIAQQLGCLCAEQASENNPSEDAITSVVRMVWAAAAGSVHLCIQPDSDIHDVFASGTPAKAVADLEDVTVAKEGMEVLTLCAALNPDVFFKSMPTSKMWQQFISDVLFLCRPRSIRSVASEQLQLMATQCTSKPEPLMALINHLFQLLQTTAKDHATFALQYFGLLCRLLSVAGSRGHLLPKNVSGWITNELEWLACTKERCSGGGDDTPAPLLEGHLGITSELISLQSAEDKYKIGADPNGMKLIETIILNFLFASSKLVLEGGAKKTLGDDQAVDQSRPVCATSQSQTAAFDLLVVLCAGCKGNLQSLCDLLTKLFYDDSSALSEWEYLPPVGPRPSRGFVGLKNAGATCYMNSVLQSLFMIPPVRNSILQANNAGWDDQDEQMAKSTKEDVVIPYNGDAVDKANLTPPDSPGNSRKDYNTSVLRHVQHIFGHLLGSQLQFHTPQGFWKTFRLWGESVNLREQHDALEFFNSLVDSVDEALKSLGHKPAVVDTLGGSFADQKICKGCPHRYAREEPFTSLNVDVRNHQHLLESLEQYVKGDLLEGANAYHCEKCDKKVDTVKRLCIKKLPRVLAIQLKRFDYDWERECAVKFNDYFEFPRQFDMEPFTVQGLAKVEGEEIRCEGDEDGEEVAALQCTKYRLSGIIVHSGQASGGHYYAFILQRSADGQPERWYRFDDNEVSECKMEDEEEMKAQCFGGEYMADIFDHMTKRMAYRRQKRWWNAYILFYEREDAPITMQKEWLAPALALQEQAAPAHIRLSVQHENLHYSHLRMHFCSEYFQFMRKLVLTNTPARGAPLVEDAEDIAMLCIRLVSSFLFTVGFRSKKTLRGPAMEWYDCLQGLLVSSSLCRRWFAANVLFKEPERFGQYLLECPSVEVRTAFCKLLVLIAHTSTKQDTVEVPIDIKSITPAGSDILHAVKPLDGQAPMCITDAILNALLSMLRHQLVDHCKHVQQYFQFYLFYASMGVNERQHLLDLDVPTSLVVASLDLAHRVQYIDLSKLHLVVAQLLRCYDTTHLQRPAKDGTPLLPNPYVDRDVLQAMPKALEAEVMGKSRYLKRVIEESASVEDSIKLLQYLSWENPNFSHSVLTEVLLQISYVYTHEMRPYTDLIMHMMMMKDSWQVARITNVLKGVNGTGPDQSIGLFAVIQRNKAHYQKRAYLCLKCLINLFTNCPPAIQMLDSDLAVRNPFLLALEWLNEEMSHVHGGYNQWSGTGQSNESANGYYLERSNSARQTLAKGQELVPQESLNEDADTSADISEVIASSPARQESSELAISGEHDSNGDDGEMVIHDDVEDSPIGTGPHHTYIDNKDLEENGRNIR